MISRAARWPVCDGVKVTLIEHFAAAARVLQPVWKVKSAEVGPKISTLMPETVAVSAVSVIVLAALRSADCLGCKFQTVGRYCQRCHTLISGASAESDR